MAVVEVNSLSRGGMRKHSRTRTFTEDSEGVVVSKG